MIESLKIWKQQGGQTIPDVTAVTLPEIFRGRPSIKAEECANGCTACVDVCPVAAITLSSAGTVSLDLGPCVFCGECADACPTDKITFTNDYKTAAPTREALVMHEGEVGPVVFNADAVRSEISEYFGGSLKLRQVSAAGCNSCELELNACGNVNFDMGRFGIEFVASPRHADGIVISGPISLNMSIANDICFDAVPDPRIVILTGACAITGGVFEKSPELQRAFVQRHHVDLYVPGCPPHPLTFINGVLQLIRKRMS